MIGATGVTNAAPGGALVQFENVTKRYGDVAAVANISLDVMDDEFFALLGPSGCGKTTLLRLLAGFETPDAGRILLAGEDISQVPPHRRPVNMMFQSYALFPHLTVESNIAFGLRQEGMARARIAERVREMLALVKLEGLGPRKPHQLSGGQRQRVALARSLAKHPRLLLLDEPLAALDKKLREDTQFELARLRERLGVTFLVVTHDQVEAMSLADRIAVMNRGAVVQVGRPAEIYEQPASAWVADFVGDVNLFDGEIAAVEGGLVRVATRTAFQMVVAGSAPVGAAVTVAIRPEKFMLLTQRPEARDNCLPGTVSDIAYQGGVSLYRVRLDTGFVVQAAAANATRRGAVVAAGDRVWLAFAPEAAVLLPPGEAS
ncbi:MAG TPA: ABC transporter ATP-binding protein [Xanthobacteraceae bacterium]|nr:ABC transporter ATP-binding protein [Xanthobacteraceae bacterium]